MNTLQKPAILVVDMLNDFVTCALTCDRAQAIVPATAQLLEAARAAGVPVIFCNDAELFHFSYQRYIENCLRNTFGFRGTPIRLIVRQRGDDKEES